MAEYVTVWRDHEPTKLHWGVPVVRCRDCKYASAGEAVISGNWQHGSCHNPRFRGSLHCANAKADGFCAWGERKVVDPTENDVDTEVTDG